MNIDYCYKMCMTQHDIPDSYEEAIASPQASEWQAAMKKELESLCNNDTWHVVELHKGERAVGAKWVYPVKLDHLNNVTKYKARYVAKGYAQRWGIDYYPTFAPTARLSTIKVLLQLCVQNDKNILHQTDVSSAYLNADIDVDLYIDQPKDFEIEGDKVCRLRKSLFGLKQAGKLWNQVLDDFLVGAGFERSEVDHCLYTKKNNNTVVYILVWVDDLIIDTNCIDDLNATKNVFSKRFNMTDMGELKWFLGIDFKLPDGCITMSHEQYLSNVLSKLNMDCKGVNTPCDKFTDSKDDDELIDSKLYRSAVGSLVYAMVATRPDLSWSVSKLSQYLAKPTVSHWKAIKRVFR